MTEEYVTDVPYVRGFEGDLSPATLRLVAALNGFRPPPAEEFAYCELGCAHGDTLAAFAASYPRARFLGVDLNRDHIAAAQAVAAGAGLSNATFLQGDFEDLASGAGVPALDYLTAHGVLSWVGPRKRKAILELAAARLKPGGLLHVSYNALPGWAPVLPLRQLILARAGAGDGSSVERARRGIDLARQMSEGGAEYFKGNPAARAMFGTMDKLGLAYVVHEYLHAHWVPMYFAELAAEMAAHDLYFVGQTPLYLNYRDLAVPATLAPLFAGVGDRITFESLKDFAINESFRRDVYVKGRAGRVEMATTDYLDETPFGVVSEPAPLLRDVVLPHHTVHYAGPVFDALLPALEAGARSARSLSGLPDLAGFGLPRVRDAVMRLLLGGQLAPTLAETSARAAPDEGPFAIPSPYNDWVLHHGVSGESPVVLASTAAGTGVELSAIEAVAMVLLCDVAPADRPARIHDLCRRESFRLAVAGRAVTTADERERVLLAEVARFRVRWLPKLLELGVVAG